MPAVPSCIIEPIWDQFQVLIPPVTDEHPLGCHRPRIPDRVVFDKLVQVLVLGAAYERISDTTCSATTIRRRRDEWIEAGAFKELEQFCLEGYEKMVGLQLENLAVDGCITKAPCGGEAAAHRHGVEGVVGEGEQHGVRRRQGERGVASAALAEHPEGEVAGDDRGPGQPPRLPTVAPDPGDTVPVRLRPAGADHRAPGRRLRLEGHP